MSDKKASLCVLTRIKKCPAYHFCLEHQCLAWVFTWDISVLHDMEMSHVSWFSAGHFVWHLSKVLENAVFYWNQTRRGLIFCLCAWHVYLTKYSKLKLSRVGHFHAGHWWAVLTRDTGGPCDMKMARVGWFYAGHFVWRLSKVLENAGTDRRTDRQTASAIT